MVGVTREIRENPSIFKTYEYDATGRPKKLVDPKNQETHYSYGLDHKLLQTS